MLNSTIAKRCFETDVKFFALTFRVTHVIIIIIIVVISATRELTVLCVVVCDGVKYLTKLTWSFFN